MKPTLSSITFGITCFERPKELDRLLKSIFMFFYDPKIIVVCDSKNTSKEEKVCNKYSNIIFIKVAYDSGLSIKRNLLMSSAKTEYLLLLEEDFIFEDSNGTTKALEFISSKPLDLIGGRVENLFDLDFTNFIVATKKILLKSDFKRLFDIILKRRFPLTHYGSFLTQNTSLNIVWYNKELESANEKAFDIYPNFFLVKLETLRSINGWQPENLKIREHALFFIRLFEFGINSCYLHDFKILHRPKKRLFYLIKRMRKYNVNTESFTKYREINY
jgi:GT2 family glycosyltransferase